jgi:hypothetical protein
MTRRKSNSTPRTLDLIGDELSNAVQNRTSGMLVIGRLLNEAKELIGHGDWLPFLKLYRIEVRSAQRYMKAAEWAAEWVTKSDTVTHFDLSRVAPKAIYALTSGRYAESVVQQVLQAACDRHVSEADVREIARAGAEATLLQEIRAHDETLARASGYADEMEAAFDEQSEQVKAEADQEQAEVDAILDGGSDPALPPAATTVASPEHFHIATFENAIAMLKSIMTKRLDMFAGAKVSPDDIDRIVDFLHAVRLPRKAA